MRSLTLPQRVYFEARASYLRQGDFPEEDHQRLVAAYLDALGLLWFHCPNGGKRNKVTGAKLKAQGAKPGVPDNFIFDAPKGVGGKRGTAIELKRPGATGRTLDAMQRLGCSSVSAEQRVWLEELAVRHWIVRVCFGFDEVRAVCRELGYER